MLGILDMYRLRYTPTCVGKTPCPGVAPSPDKVHPHVCGENYNPLTASDKSKRYTPTCVGKTGR